VRRAFILSNNPLTKLADLAIYRVSPGTIGKSIRKSWRADPELPPEETLEPDDYRNAHHILHTDRGHLVPLASLSALPEPEALSYLSNVTPQRSILNQNAWIALEAAVRNMVFKRPVEAAFVITGPLFERAMPTLPEADEPHQVPSGYFKIVAWDREGSPEVAAFIMDQQTRKEANYCDFHVPVRQVEKRAEIDVFSDLPDSVEETVESENGLLLGKLGCVAP
jgi:endonuclease G